MQGILTAAVAVAGTLLGSAVTYWFQGKASKRAESFSFQLQLRAERVIAYSDFAGAISQFSTAQDHRWFRKKEDPDSHASFDARIERDKLGSNAYHALTRVQLLADNADLITAADMAYRLTSDLHHASSGDDLQHRAVMSSKALQDFIKIASNDVQQSHSLSRR
jgi:hypothetical protein